MFFNAVYEKMRYAAVIRYHLRRGEVPEAQRALRNYGRFLGEIPMQ